VDEIARQIEPLIPGLRRYAFALTRDHEAADDLVQDCLERVVSRWHLRRRDGDLRAWVYTIQRNLYVNDYHRRRRRGVAVALEDAGVPPVPPGQSATVELGEVMAALDGLPEEQKSILLLVGVEELTYQETAGVLGLPLGTVMSRLSRARARLRALLEPERAMPLRRVK